MQGSGKTTVSAPVTVWSANRNESISFSWPIELESLKQNGCDELFGSQKDWEKTKLVRMDIGTVCGDDELLYKWVEGGYPLQLLRPGQRWEPTSATPGKILEREMSLKEKQEERQHEIRKRETSLKEKQEERRRTNNNISLVTGAAGSAVVVGVGIAACCACPPLLAAYSFLGFGGSTLVGSLFAFSWTSPPSS